jgi:hypothetical protein
MCLLINLVFTFNSCAIHTGNDPCVDVWYQTPQLMQNIYFVAWLKIVCQASDGRKDQHKQRTQLIDLFTPPPPPPPPHRSAPFCFQVVGKKGIVKA